MDEVVFRPARVEDIPALGDLIRSAEAHDRVPRVLDDAELVQDLSAPYVDLDDDSRLVVTGDGAIVGWSLVWHPPSQHRLDRVFLFADVAPDHRGRGIGRTLLEWGIDRARHRLREQSHDLPRFIRVSAYEWLEDRARLYRRFGFEPVRYHDEMIRALDDVPAVAIETDDTGVDIRPWPDDRDEEIRTVRNKAFADHWGSTVIEPEQWHDFVRGHGARADLSLIAVDRATDAVVGLCANQAYPEDEAVTGRRDAWIATVGTVREMRGRGIASALIARSLALFAEAGFTHALLEVDTENPTGAARLYRALGFESLHRSVTYAIEVAPPRRTL